MSKTVLKIENVSKLYRLGEVGTGTISHDLNRWWHKVRGKEDPYQQIGAINQRDQKGDTDYVWALKDINLEIKQGEILGIIGANGAGKSTLLKILSKVTAPTTGRIRGKGKISALLEVGTGFHPELTARENIYLNGAILGMRRQEITKQLDKIVDFAGIERYLDTPVKRFSSGMKVRLGFAVAAHLQTDILIVDEVLAVGDAEFQEKCIGKMGDISRGEGKTVLFVSHNMDSIMILCKQSIILEQGFILEQGLTNSIINSHLTKSAASIINPHSYTINEETSITKVSFSNIEGKLINDLNAEKEFTLKITVKSKIIIEKAFFIIYLNDWMGNRIFMLRGDDNNFHFNINQINKSYELFYHFMPLRLLTGTYYLGITMTKTRGNPICRRKNIIIKISNPSSPWITINSGLFSPIVKFQKLKIK